MGYSYTAISSGETETIHTDLLGANIEVYPGGTLYIASGGVVNNTSVAGAIRVQSGGIANNTHLFGLEGCLLFVSSGGIVSGTKVQYDTSLYLYGNAYLTTVNDGYVHVRSGGVMSATTFRGRWCYLSSGASACHTTVYTGIVYVSSGATAVSTHLSKSGTMDVSGGGLANNTYVSSGGLLNIGSGGIANNVFISGGTLCVASGGSLTGQMSFSQEESVIVANGAHIQMDLTQTSPGASAFITHLNMINGYSAEWEMVATGDFNADGKCDMLWKNSFEGDGDLTYNAYCTWIMDDPIDWRMVSVANPAEWNFLCSGDFNADGANDIAMINNEGVVGIWGVEDGWLSSWSILSAVTSEWQLAGVGDFNADGTDDIAWCNTDTGLVGYWQIEDKELASWQTLVHII